MTLQDVILQAGGLTQQAEGSRIEVSRIMEYDISSNWIPSTKDFSLAKLEIEEKSNTSCLPVANQNLPDWFVFENITT